MRNALLHANIGQLPAAVTFPSIKTDDDPVAARNPRYPNLIFLPRLGELEKMAEFRRYVAPAKNADKSFNDRLAGHRTVLSNGGGIKLRPMLANLFQELIQKIQLSEIVVYPLPST